jgi:hypothetical protein
MAAPVTRLFMVGQAHSALGTTKIVTGDVHERKAIWRIDQTAPEGPLHLGQRRAHFGDERSRLRRRRGSSYRSSSEGRVRADDALQLSTIGSARTKT